MARLVVTALAGLALGLIIGGVAGWAIGRAGNPTVQVLEGYTTAVNATGTAIGLTAERGGSGQGYDIAGVWWRWADVDGPWTKTPATCAIPLTQGQRVRLGVVQVPPVQGAPGGPKVAWLECLDRDVVPMDASAVAAARSALAARLGVSPGQVQVTWIEEATWSDTSLGCPEPGQAYAQVIVPGLRITLEHQGQQSLYHTNQDGSHAVTC